MKAHYDVVITVSADVLTSNGAKQCADTVPVLDTVHSKSNTHGLHVIVFPIGLVLGHVTNIIQGHFTGSGASYSSSAQGPDSI